MKVGGVPEHYNAPVLKALEGSIDIEWVSHPSGTGAMLEALDKGELDMAIILTEGAVKQAVTHHSVKLLGTFVDNPLPWGVHVHPGGPLKSMSDFNSNISNLTFGISRFGSGSHLMALVHAASTCSSDPEKNPKFKIVNTMSGAREAMVKGEIDVFLWDVTTADVFARQGDWTCIGTVSGDWPSFVFAVRSGTNESDIVKLEDLIKNIGIQGTEMKKNGDLTTRFLTDKFGISEKQAREFIEIINWNCKLEVSQSALNRVVSALSSSGIISGCSACDFSPIIVTGKTRLV